MDKTPKRERTSEPDTWKMKLDDELPAVGADIAVSSFGWYICNFLLEGLLRLKKII